MGKFQPKVSQYVCFIIWKSHWTKIVPRLLKLTVLYIRIDESVWHPNTEPNFFRTRFVKRLIPAERFIFQIMQLLWTLTKKIDIGPNHGGGPSSTLAHSRYMYHYSQKYSGCKNGLYLSQAITMSVRSCPILLKISGMF